ncbi:MAG TPA: DUF4288 domain-containing protein [Verrucomicrobiae bacterium]|nr:DUF4288 domain-containing protein [Verrucomicrobiae bacterium]
MNLEFYSARLLFIILVDDGKPKKKNHFDESIIVFRAKNFSDAFKRAIRLGKTQETNYLNDKKQRVRWTLVDILNLDCVGNKIDGKEVASRLHYRRQKKPIPTNKKFHPESSKPEQSF